jgi:hypothetical protein
MMGGLCREWCVYRSAGCCRLLLQIHFYPLSWLFWCPESGMLYPIVATYEQEDFIRNGMGLSNMCCVVRAC